MIVLGVTLCIHVSCIIHYAPTSNRNWLITKNNNNNNKNIWRPVCLCVLCAETGNHLLTVKKVQDKQVTAAAVDSTAFYNYKNVLHRDSDNISVLLSVGPLPPYAIVCRKHLNGKIRLLIAHLNAMYDVIVTIVVLDSVFNIQDDSPFIFTPVFPLMTNLCCYWSL